MQNGTNDENGGHTLPLVLDGYDLTDRQLLEVGCHLFNRLHRGASLRPPHGFLKLPLSVPAEGRNGAGIRLAHTTVWQAQQHLGMLRLECEDGTEIDITATHDIRMSTGVLRALIRAPTRNRCLLVQRVLVELLRWLELG